MSTLLKPLDIDDLPDISLLALPDDSFFAWNDPHDETAFKTYLEKRDLDGKASRQYLLGDKPYPVEVVARWHALNFPWTDSNFPLPDHRQVPAALLDDSFSNPTSAVTITLAQPIKIGIPASSQVWRGTIRASAPHTSQPESPAAPMVIKIFVESALAPPWQFAVERGLDQGFWPFSGKQARTEASAYACTRTLQGKEVPWSYGFYQLRLPYGEVAYAHVMELVPGQPMRSMCLHDTPQLCIWSLADSMATCLHAITRCGVLQGDVDKRNMILAPIDSPQRIVFIDFNLAGPVRAHCTDPSVQRVMLINDIGGIVRALREMEVPLATIGAWLEDRRRAPQSPAWISLFLLVEEVVPQWYEAVSVTLANADEQCYHTVKVPRDSQSRDVKSG